MNNEINETLTRGMFNCRNSSKFKGYSSHQVHRNLKDNSSEIGN